MRVSVTASFLKKTLAIPCRVRRRVGHDSTCCSIEKAVKRMRAGRNCRPGRTRTIILMQIRTAFKFSHVPVGTAVILKTHAVDLNKGNTVHTPGRNGN